MGWTFAHVSKGQKLEEFFKNEFNYTNETGSSYTKVLSCKAKPTEAYLAVEYKEVGKEPVVYGMVCLINRRKNDYCNFGYKSIDEGMGPYYYNCPKSILNLLSPTENESALEWRATCLENISKNEVRKTLEVSDTIKFEREFSFGSLGKTDTFVVRDLKKSHFFAPAFHTLVKLRKSTVNNNPWIKVN